MSRDFPVTAVIFSKKEEERRLAQSERNEGKVSLRPATEVGNTHCRLQNKLERETKLFVTEMLQLIMATAWGTEVSQETGKSLTGSELYHFDQRKDHKIQN